MRTRMSSRTTGWVPASWFIQQAWVVRRRKPLRRALAIVLPVTLVATAAFAFSIGANATAVSNPQTLYGGISNGLPTSSSFFPIAVFGQSPGGGDVPAPYSNQAQAFKAMGVNVIIAPGYGWPSSYGQDSHGEMAAACAAGMYTFDGSSAGTAASGSATSVASVYAAIQTLTPACQKWVVGYDLGDEQSCGTNVAAQAAAAHAIDPTRMAESGSAGFYPGPNTGSCAATYTGSDVLSGDTYAITNSYLHVGNTGTACLSGSSTVPSDCLWLYGLQTQNMLATSAGINKPTWVDLESGTDFGNFSEANGACNATTNLCARGNEMRAEPWQVNSAAWLTLINGSNGLLWFCDDEVSSSDACVGGGVNGNASACAPTCGIASNLSYIDHTVEGYAPALNASNAAASPSPRRTPPFRSTR